MENNDKLFKAGEIILEKKQYGFTTVIVISIAMAGLIFLPILNKFDLPYIIFFRVLVLVITIIICTFSYDRFIKEKIFPNSEFLKRYEDIVLFDNHLLGRMNPSLEDKIEFKDIKHITNEGNNIVSITFNEEFKHRDFYGWKYLPKNNLIQDYKISVKLSKLQKKELVDYLNERIKSENNQ